MSRYETIQELAKYAHKDWYHSLIEWKTCQLKALLTYYREGGKFPGAIIGEIKNTKTIAEEAKLYKHAQNITIKVTEIIIEI